MAFLPIDVNTIMSAAIVTGGGIIAKKLNSKQNQLKTGQGEIHELVNSELSRVVTKLETTEDKLADLRHDAVEQIASLRNEIFNLRELSSREGGTAINIQPSTPSEG